MVPDSTRRATLQTSAALLAGLAGCSGVLGGSSSTDPDAGTDSYGVLVQNRTAKSHSFGVTAETLDGEQVFDRSVEVAAESTHEWDSVLTKDAMHRIDAALDGWTESNLYTDQNYVDVGGKRAPDYPNVVVRAYRDEYHDQEHTYLRVLVTEAQRKKARPTEN